MPKGVYVRSSEQLEQLRERNRSPQMRSIPRVISDEARQRMSEARTIHGHTRRSQMGGRNTSSTFHVWAAMIQRCTNPRNRDWGLYGGRGITVCERWRIFAHFLADMGEAPEGLTLDRRDNDGNYEPGNCRWVTPFEQVHNRRPPRRKR